MARPGSKAVVHGGRLIVTVADQSVIERTTFSHSEILEAAAPLGVRELHFRVAQA